MTGAFQIGEHGHETIKPAAALETGAGPKGESAGASDML
jgi:hypothetical protein